jgi:hypothetical protein
MPFASVIVVVDVNRDEAFRREHSPDDCESVRTTVEIRSRDWNNRDDCRCPTSTVDRWPCRATTHDDTTSKANSTSIYTGHEQSTNRWTRTTVRLTNVFGA